MRTGRAGWQPQPKLFQSVKTESDASGWKIQSMTCLPRSGCCQKAPGIQELGSSAQHHCTRSRIIFAASLPHSIFSGPVGTHISCGQGAGYPCPAQLSSAGLAAVSEHRRVRSTPEINPGIWLKINLAPRSPEKLLTKASF